jgi:hypothetical protein
MASACTILCSVPGAGPSFLLFLPSPDKVSGEDGRELINFAKMHLLAKVIDEIRFYQQDPYVLEPVTAIQRWLEDEEQNQLSEKEVYELSLRAEPRQNPK